jgi:hypothetical protein
MGKSLPWLFALRKSKNVVFDFLRHAFSAAAILPWIALCCVGFSLVGWFERQADKGKIYRPVTPDLIRDPG